MASAQVSASECAAAADSLAAGNQSSIFWGQLPRCGPTGAAALAGAVANAAQETNTEYLGQLLAVAGYVRDPQILDAAGDLVENQAAQIAARIMGVALLAAEYNPSFGITMGATLDDLANGPITPCPIVVFGSGYYLQTAQLQPDSLARFADPLDLARSVSQPAAVRDLAACLRNRLSHYVPIVVPTELIGIAYRCDNRFVIENDSRDWLNVTVTIDGTTESADLAVPPTGAPVLFSALHTGTARVFQHGVLVADADNLGIPCE